MSDIVLVLGTRPEIIKLAPVIRACEARSLSYSILHTGQHYSEGLDAVFFEQLELPSPDYELDVGSGTHGEQTGQMLQGVEAVLQESRPETVLVQGDTNTVLAGAIATSKLDPDLGHVEAGLRSFDRGMPEETNRVLTDHCSDYLFAPTEQSRDYLRREGLPDERIHVTGNTVVDAVQQNRAIAERKSTALETHGLDPGGFVLLTAHRAENVDDDGRFADILAGADAVSDALGYPVLYPIHPRARKRIDEGNLPVPPSIALVEPLSYLEFLELQAHAAVVLTDSGGVQEETCTLGTPCVTLRDTTERPETLEVGSNRLVGTDPDTIRSAAIEMASVEPNWSNPYGDGDAAERILDVVS